MRHRISLHCLHWSSEKEQSRSICLKSEQDRIADQLARISDLVTSLDANFEQAQEVLGDTLDLTRACHGADMESSDDTRSDRPI